MNALRWVTMVSGICVFFACGDPVSSGGGSGGGEEPGDGGAPTTLQSVSSSGGSVGDGGSNGGGGEGGNAGGNGGAGGAPSECEETCAMLDACGQPLCGPGGLFDCSVEPPTHNTCWLDCVGDSTCQEVNAFIAGTNAPLLEACLGACDAGQLCKDCMYNSALPANCSVEFNACAGDAACTAWGQCALACGTPGCNDGCDTMHPAGETLDDLYECICNVGKCGDVCSQVFTCPGP